MKRAFWDWNPEINWDAPAGRLLLSFASLLDSAEPVKVTVFGSVPLQLTIDPSFVSGDVDIFSEHDFSTIIAKAELGKGQTEPYIEQTPPNIFIASSNWQARAHSEQKDGIIWTFPHPLDILVAKVKRCADKDINAFRLVIRETGHPTEDELRSALQGVVDMYRPAFDEENPGGDPIANTQLLWETLYGHSIDVRAEIIRPALEVRRVAYGLDLGHRAALRKRLEES